MTVEELMEILEQYPSAMQVFVLTKDLHNPEIAEYDLGDIPEILVIS